MKRISLLIIGVISAFSAVAQSAIVEKNFPYTNQTLDVDMDFGTGLKVRAWNKNEISVKATYSINEGKSNDAIKLDIDNYDNRLSIDVDLDLRKIEAEAACCCNNGPYWSVDKNKQVCAEVLIEVFIPASSDLWLNTIIADVEIEGMNGNIEVETVTGDIDLIWSESEGAEVTMKTTTGAVYTNLELDSKKDKGLLMISSHNVRGTYKNGGKEILLKTVTSNIYFKKPGS